MYQFQIEDSCGDKAHHIQVGDRDINRNVRHGETLFWCHRCRTWVVTDHDLAMASAPLRADKPKVVPNEGAGDDAMLWIGMADQHGLRARDFQPKDAKRNGPVTTRHAYRI